MEIEAYAEVGIAESVGELKVATMVVVIVEHAKSSDEPATGVVDETEATSDIEVDVTTTTENLVETIEETRVVGGRRFLFFLEEDRLGAGALIADGRCHGDTQTPTAMEDPVVGIAARETIVNILQPLERTELVFGGRLCPECFGKSAVIVVNIVVGDAGSDLP